MFRNALDKENECLYSVDTASKTTWTNFLEDFMNYQEMDYQELEQCIQCAIYNNYHIIYSRKSELDFVFIRSKRLLMYNENVQLLFNSTLEKLRKGKEINAKMEEA